MAGRQSAADDTADDTADARIRLSEDILRDSASRSQPQDNDRPRSEPQSPPPEPQPQSPSQQYAPSSPSIPRRATSPVSRSSAQHPQYPLRINTDLYTIQSHVEVPEAHGGRPTTARGAGADKGGALPTVSSPIRDDGASSSARVPAIARRRVLEDGEGAANQQLRAAAVHQNRRSGVSFVEPPPPSRSPSFSRSRLGLGDLEGFEAPTKSKTATAARVAETSETLAHYRDWLNRQRERQGRWAKGPYGRLKSRSAAIYQKYIVEGLLRQRPLAPSADGRHIPLDPGRVRTTPLTDERSGRPFISNFIRSSRYTVWNFLPKQLVFQFMKLANFYFLIISILQMIPGLSTTGTYTTIIPLLFFVSISMFKEGYDDYRRYRLDKVENRSKAFVLDPGHTVANGKPKQRGWWSRLKQLKQRQEEKWSVTAQARRQNRNRQPAGVAEVEAGMISRDSDVSTAGMTELESVRSALDGSAQGPPGSEPRQRMPWAAVEWQDLRVGDIVRLRRDDSVPADMVVLHATGPNGVAYIETMALDGETNLKTKQACTLLSEHCESLAGMAACGAEIVSEDPNLDLYNYEGRVIVNGQTMPLTLNQIVFRGSVVRNTAEMIGLVVNSGEECKIRMNAHRHKRAKAPAMQFIVNRIVILLVIFVVLLAVGCSIGNGLWVRHYARKAWYLDHAGLPLSQILFAFVIMFNTLIPLSLYVSLEIIKLGQLYLLADMEMYDPETDTPMAANTSTILENLGQVSYIFSDKTGTLTENKMRFRKMSVAGTAWLHDMDIARDAEEKEKKRKQMVHGRKRTKASHGKSQEHHRRYKPDGKQLATTSAKPLSHSDQEALPSRTPSARDIAPNVVDSTAAAGGAPRRSMSISHWRSTARPSRNQPELKTEDLIEYIRHRPNTAFSRKARQFILCVALCHTCLPETMPDGTIEFQAASPDELALVQAARDLGYLLIDRPAQSIKLQFQQPDGSSVIETYQVLDVIEFSSKRKRMSIVIRMPDGRICMFCKGADSVILPRLKLNQMALAKASAVERRASKRKSVEQERAMQRKSTAASIGGGPATPRTSLNLVRAGSMNHQLRGISRVSTGKKSMDNAGYRKSGAFSGDVDDWLRRREREDIELVDDVERQEGSSSVVKNGNGGSDMFASASQQRKRSQDGVVAAAAAEGVYDDPYENMVDEALAVNEGAVFERCFQHIDDFASEGLRTLLFAYRYVEDTDYRKWKTIYQDATTSLVNRQERIEAAADLLEQGFDLAGATAIEDKLQQGVPETVDKMRRANIKIWMLTGDKRETAINIAHAARICKPFSEIYVLDASVDGDNLQERIASTLVDVSRGMMPHCVVVIDGHTLGVVESQEEMRILFYDLVARVDSVICCRASPAQKATLVKCIRQRVPSSMTLAIGDGANDIAMIQASHVGIGISGREGLQAARISDYSIAQFRFLQRLLLVHGRWNYIRTGKYILGTFWKEMVFYLVQALYQRYNGYTGTSLYESTSLTVFNTLFTSLPVILLGIFEKDLRAATLLAVPELYTYGQRNQGFCFRKYVGWMSLAVAEALLIFYVLYAVYSNALFTSDTTLYAMGSLAFTVCVLFINIKMLVLELHNQTIISAIGLTISISGWFLWSILLSAIYKKNLGPYVVHGAFLHNFGRSATWWVTLFVALMAVIVFELLVNGVRRAYFSTDQDLMQQFEHYEDVRAVFKEHAAENGEAGGLLVETQGPAAGVGSASPADSMRKSSVGNEPPRTSYSVGGATALMTSANSVASASFTPAGSPTIARRCSPRIDEDAPPPFSPPVTASKGKDAATAEATPKSPSLQVPSFQPSPVSPRKPQIPILDTSSQRWLAGDLGSPSSPSKGAFTVSPVEVRFP